ncbi:MAG TPA: enoyl-CoA hydratase/isomerase family protein [Kofleriaceae bacterium]
MDEEVLVVADVSPAGLETVRVERRDRVAHLFMNRPDKLNALNSETLASMRAAIEELAHASDLEVVVITGAGRAFSAGGDLKEETAVGTEAEQCAVLREKASLVESIRAMPQLTIAAINGACAGAAVGIAAACDLRYMASSAFVDTAYARLGYSGDFGVAYFLYEQIGPGRAIDWLVRPRRIDSAEAASAGFSHCSFDDENFSEAIGQIAAHLARQDHLTRESIFQNVAEARTRALGPYLDMEGRRHVASKRRAADRS